MNRFQIACLVFLLNPFTISGQSVIINEISQGLDGGKEWVELLVISDGVDLKGWELGDNDDGNWHPIALFKYIDTWSSVSSGTIIVLYNGGDVDPVIIARGGEDTDFSDGSVMLPIGSSTYFADTGPWGLTGGAFSNSDADDCPAIRNSDGVTIHDMAITHPTATVPSPGLGKAKYYTGNTTAGISDDSQWAVTTSSAGTPGLTNGGDNSNWVDQSLPVELSQWFASSAHGHVILNWITESEFENQGFKIERSQNTEDSSQETWGEEIASFTTHPDLQGQGSSTNQQSYSFKDTHVKPGKTYVYRLSDVDYRGNVTPHAEIHVRVEPPGGNHTSQIKTYPNPSNAGIHIVLKNDQGIKHLQVDVLNLKGELVKNVFSGEPLQSEMVLPWGGMDLDDIPVPSGVYIAKVSGPNMSHSKVFTIIQ